MCVHVCACVCMCVHVCIDAVAKMPPEHLCVVYFYICASQTCAAAHLYIRIFEQLCVCAFVDSSICRCAVAYLGTCAFEHVCVRTFVDLSIVACVAVQVFWSICAFERLCIRASVHLCVDAFEHCSFLCTRSIWIQVPVSSWKNCKTSNPNAQKNSYSVKN